MSLKRLPLIILVVGLLVSFLMSIFPQPSYEEQLNEQIRQQNGNIQPGDWQKYASEPARALAAYLYEQESVFSPLPIETITNFNDQSGQTRVFPFYLRAEYITPEVISAKNFPDTCQVNKITKFETFASPQMIEAGHNAEEYIEVSYSGPNALVIASFYKTADTLGVFNSDPTDPYYVFSAAYFCYPISSK